ncbi:multicomponent Na+:H+ antiporter subunit F [Rubritalea squalenifaciens DSM 18772]|uniref:Multicomponent Na+:H+ antiporter subunit F n=2 Tax=Rubritalea TaxID=361050 RepID=A0A1M6DRM4_9BACT|nr:monovalent cation/H+ antiporter complex subunit F [Rubritalea squalenifaciens]SHI75658.1 multicomponent Na+:H+ antiporter subunit F [Rubritalea squalenifaciens DSM 18772]
MYFDPIELPSWVYILSKSMLTLAMLFTAWRMWLGPTVMDRVVALDLLAALIMGQCVIHTMETGFMSYLDIATAIAIISFLATVAFARYLENKNAPL